MGVKQATRMLRIAHILQLIVSLAVLGLFWLIYPGVMALVASAVALLYTAAAIGALRGSKGAGAVALAFTAATAILATLAVLRFAGNGFDYLAGNFERYDGIYWLPYAFVAVALGATLVVLLQVVAMRSRGAATFNRESEYR